MDPPPDGQPPEPPTDAILPTQGVGALPGAIAIDADGNGTYHMALAVPPGRAGMQPTLALSYSSARGNGLLGAGFGLEGLSSSVSRCVHPHEEAGARRVNLTSTDRLCLDGEPLLLDGASGSEYGAPGTEYRTERESVRRVVAGTSGDVLGVGQFTVYGDDGRILTYATLVQPDRVQHTALDGRSPTITRSPILRWDLTRIEDRHGNSIELQYETSHGGLGGGEPEPFFRHRLRRIVYTRWRFEAGRRSVEILYEPRPDPSDAWLAGVRERIDYRVSGLEMHAPDATGATHLAWSYAFDYLDEVGEASVTGRSLLRTVTLCDAYGGCLPPTSFEWTRGETRYVQARALTNEPGVAGHLSLQLADVDGDGRDDLVSRTVFIDSHMSLRVHLSDGSGRFRSVDAVLDAALTHPPLIADLTGDGVAELVGAEQLAPLNAPCVSDASCGSIDEHCVKPSPEALGFCSPSCACVINMGSNEPPPPGGSCGEGASTTCVSTPGDSTCRHFDGDDVPECVTTAQLEGTGWRVHHFRPAAGVLGRGQLIGGNAMLPGHGAITLGDFDGDGAPDLLRRDADAMWSYGRNTYATDAIFADPMGRGEPAAAVYFDPRDAGGGGHDEHSYGAVTQLADLDADGLTDVLVPVQGSGAPNRYWLANPAGGSAIETNLPAVYRDHLLIDVNGDGLPDAVELGNRVDAVAVPPGESRLRVRFNTGNGFGARVQAIAAADYHPFWPDESWQPGTPVAVEAQFPEAWHTVDLRVRVLDYDQDGRDDFLMLGPEPRIYVSTGEGFEAHELPFAHDDARVEVAFRRTGHSVTRRPPFLVGDINGDGRPDFVHGEDLRVHVSAGQPPDLLVRVTNGLGAIDRFTYGSLGDDDVYDASTDGHRAGGCGFPLACGGRRRVVARAVRWTNPGHPDRTVRQRYQGLRRDARTGTSLGFTRIYTEDPQRRARSELWFDPLHEYVPPGAAMRGAYHPLARRPTRVYTEVHVGQRASVDRHDVRYVATSSAVGPGEPHPLLLRNRLVRGYRFRVADTLVRSYDDAWASWAGGGGAVSDRYVAMRDRVVDAWRTDRRAFQYGQVECVDPSDPDTARPCVTRLRLTELFPYPASATTLTYDGDVAGAGAVDWGPSPSGLREYDHDVVALARTLYERSDDEGRWLIGQPRFVETERCAGPEPTDAGQLRCSIGGPEVVRRRIGVEYLEDRPRVVTREPQRQYDLDPDGAPTSLFLRTTFGYTRGLVTDIQVESAAGQIRHREVALDALERQFPAVLRSHVGG